jgi:hypothetical protein
MSMERHQWPPFILTSALITASLACSLATLRLTTSISYQSEANGISFRYPAGWLITDAPELISLATGPGLTALEPATFSDGEAVILLVIVKGVPASELGEDLVEVLLGFATIGARIGYPTMEDAHIVTINDKEFAIAGYDITLGPGYPNFMAVYGEGDVTVVATAHTSLAYQSAFRPMFEDLLGSIEIEQGN